MIIIYIGHFKVAEPRIDDDIGIDTERLTFKDFFTVELDRRNIIVPFDRHMVPYTEIELIRSTLCDGLFNITVIHSAAAAAVKLTVEEALVDEIISDVSGLQVNRHLKECGITVDQINISYFNVKIELSILLASNEEVIGIAIERVITGRGISELYKIYFLEVVIKSDRLLGCKFLKIFCGVFSKSGKSTVEDIDILIFIPFVKRVDLCLASKKLIIIRYKSFRFIGKCVIIGNRFLNLFFKVINVDRINVRKIIDRRGDQRRFIHEQLFNGVIVPNKRFRRFGKCIICVDCRLDLFSSGVLVKSKDHINNALSRIDILLICDHIVQMIDVGNERFLLIGKRVIRCFRRLNVRCRGILIESIDRFDDSGYFGIPEGIKQFFKF